MEPDYEIISSKSHFPFEKFKEVFEQLPLEGCRLESSNHQYLERQSFNYPTDFYQFVAPDGKIFKLTGDFTVRIDSDEESYFFDMPSESPSLVLKNKLLHSDSYDDDDFPRSEYPDESFYGRRLAVSIGDYHFGSPKLPDFSFDDDMNIEVSIEGPCDAWAEHCLVRLLLEERSGSDSLVAYYYVDPVGFVKWRFDIASGSIENSTVELIDDNIPKPDFKLAHTDYEEQARIWVPNNHTIESERRYQESHGHTPTKDELVGIMRRYRDIGMPFGDDPMRHCYVVRNRSDGQPIDIDDLVRQFQNLKGIENTEERYFTIGDTRFVRPEYANVQPKPKYIKGYRLGKFAVISGDVSVEQIVADEKLRQKCILLGEENPDEKIYMEF